MPHDKRGSELHVGDTVMVPCLVKAIHLTEDFCNVDLQTKIPMPPLNQDVQSLTLNSRQTIKPTVTHRFVEYGADQHDDATVAAAPSSPSAGWQDLESAPKDGRRLLMCLGEDRAMFPDPCILRWGIEGTGEYEGWIDAEEFAPDPQPTCWMPLPLPPESK